MNGPPRFLRVMGHFYAIMLILLYRGQRMQF